MRQQQQQDTRTATTFLPCTASVGSRKLEGCCRNSLGFAGGPNSEIMHQGASAGFQRWIQPRGVTAREVPSSSTVTGSSLKFSII
jgi:hypothetical protein